MINKFANGVGIVMVLAGLVLFGLIYLPIFKEEVNYQKTIILKEEKKVVKPVDENFGIVVEKIGANSRVIAGVDPNDSRIYQEALSRGVAQAKGTGLPGQGKRIFLFSHSSVDWWEANRYNSIFYLLEKLEIGDEIKIYYQTKEYKYKVSGKEVVESTRVDYLTAGNKEELVLMTCWPAGTDLKRLIVVAKP